MNMAADDLIEIRHIVESALAKQTGNIIKPLQDELQALRNDIKEIYDMIAEFQGGPRSEKEFNKLSLEKKLLELNAKLLSAAKQAGISLPR